MHTNERKKEILLSSARGGVSGGERLVPLQGQPNSSDKMELRQEVSQFKAEDDPKVPPAEAPLQQQAGGKQDGESRDHKSEGSAEGDSEEPIEEVSA